MADRVGLRDRKKEATRLAISNVATRLFVERGFEAVPVAEVAREAGVARKTVFNYFPRKEDLVFDREDEVRALVADALDRRGARPPVLAFRGMVLALLEAEHPLFLITERPILFWRMVARSPALTTRARELQVSLADDLGGLLCAAAGRPPSDPDGRLAAAMLMSTLVVAYGAAQQAFGDGRPPGAALRGVMERGFAGVEAALAGTAYV